MMTGPLEKALRFPASLLLGFVAASLLAVASAATAENVEFAWAGSVGGPDVFGEYSVEDLAVAVDASGNAYTTGHFRGTVDFDPGAGTFNLTSAGSVDFFVQKLDASGNFVWAKQVDDGGSIGIAVDASENVYTIGLFRHTVDFDPGAGTFNLTSAGNNDIFVQKLDASGNFVWAKQMGGVDEVEGGRIALDASGNVYTAGHFRGTVDFDPGAGTFNLTSAGNSDIFVQKLDASGNFVWAKQMAVDNASSAYEFPGIGVDALENVYITASFLGTVDFDPGAGTFNLTSAGSGDIFVQKLDASGNFVWAKQMGGVGSDGGAGIAVDASGNAYTTGHFLGTVDFDPGAGTFNFTTAGSSDAYVSKLDASGNFVWAKQMGGVGGDVGGGIAVDASENVYTMGRFSRTVDFDPGPGAFSLTSPGSWSGFVQKLSPSQASAELAAETISGLGGAGFAITEGHSIAVDASGDALVTGQFSETVDFDPGPLTENLTSTGFFDAFVTRLDTDANFLFAAQVGSPGTQAHGHGTAMDASGNMYTTGYFQGTADFDPGPATFHLTSAGSWDIFVQKLDPAGNFLWATRMGSSGLEAGSGIVVDAARNVYITGHFSGTVDFDPGPATASLTSAGNSDIFVQKLDDSGSLLWATRMGSTDADFGQDVTVDASGAVYVTGHFQGTADFDPGPGVVALTSAGSADVFVSKLDASGGLLWAERMGGTGFDAGNGLALDDSGSVFTTGYFQGTADFDPSAGTAQLTSAGGYDVFVHGMDGDGNFGWARAMGGVEDDYGNSVAVDTAGNLYGLGDFEGTAAFDFGAGAANLTSAGQADIFVSRLSRNGDFVWVGQIGGAGLDQGKDIAVDGSGSVFVTGFFEGTADLDPGAAVENFTTGFLRDGG